MVSGYCRPPTGSVPGEYARIPMPPGCICWTRRTLLSVAHARYLQCLGLHGFSRDSSHSLSNMEAFCSTEEGTPASVVSQRLVKEWKSKSYDEDCARSSFYNPKPTERFASVLARSHLNQRRKSYDISFTYYSTTTSKYLGSPHRSRYSFSATACLVPLFVISCTLSQIIELVNAFHLDQMNRIY